MLLVNASITPADVDNGSHDVCGIDDVSLDITSFNCANIGDNTVILTATDNNANTSSCTAIVTIEDNTTAMAICQDITVELDANGNTSIVAADVDGGSTDACGIASLAVSNDTFDCSNTGDNTVILTVTDNNANTSSCEATVTVEDNIPPSIVCPSDMLVCELFLNYPMATADDNCVNTSIVYSPSSPIDLSAGINVVTVTATDDSGNTTDCTFEVAYIPLSVSVTASSDYNGFGVSCFDSTDGEATANAHR